MGHALLNKSDAPKWMLNKLKSKLPIFLKSDKTKTISWRRFLVIHSILNNVGTFRSAREKKIETEEEFFYECFAQYLLTGNITFNIPTRDIKSGVEGSDALLHFSDVKLQEKLAQVLSVIKDAMIDEFNLLNTALGEIFIM